MKKILAMFAMLTMLGLVGKVTAETDTTCTRNIAGEIIANPSNEPVTDTNGNTGQSCKEVPDFYKIKVFRFGLCSANPFPTSDLSSCSFFVNSDTGVEHVITYPTEAKLSINNQMAVGTYGYMVLILDNRLGIKHTERFSIPVFGATGSGQQCWTINSTTSFVGQRSGVLQASPETPAMDCGDTPAPAYTYEIYDSMGIGEDAGGDGENPVFSATGGEGFEAPSGKMYARLLKSDNVTTATTFQDADRMLVSIALTTPKTITVDSSFQLRFKMSDSVSVDLAYDDGVNRLYAIKNGADPFQIDLVINN